MPSSYPIYHLFGNLDCMSSCSLLLTNGGLEPLLQRCVAEKKSICKPLCNLDCISTFTLLWSMWYRVVDRNLLEYEMFLSLFSCFIFVFYLSLYIHFKMSIFIIFKDKMQGDVRLHIIHNKHWSSHAISYWLECHNIMTNDSKFYHLHYTGWLALETLSQCHLSD